ncbi:hypothetical protein [Hymenobacter cellulosilyticus]|uniref:Glycerophosphoryl diester phosphodiesterase membrane domain-containing protein n=1 Tax=Hymenobacter cellulosilyticus TaxID=2932248 RepID=A0A8T9Q4W6_9BACT|nr:hypothetical protein [Hymenobacter cellulosilyticus]UOQ72022.1 hypothetical protein MUN79_26135 [Hymenobacter cellulosilyticus]
MKSTFTTAADFRQERDFGNKIAATFEFITAHWRPLGKCLVYFVLPAALIMGAGMGILTNTAFNGIGSSNSGNTPQFSNGAFFSGAGLTMLGALVAGTLLMGTVYGYLRILLTTETVPTPALVWQVIKSRIGRMFGAFALLLGIYMLVSIALVALMAITSFFGVLFLIIFPAFVYVMVPLTLFFPILWLEEDNLWQSLRRSFYLVQGKWWSTAGLLVVTGMIQGMLCIVFMLPQYAVLLGKILKIPGLDSDVLGILTQCLYALGIMFTYAIPLMASSFQYFNLVERKEGLGLRSLIGTIGQGSAPLAYNQAYRPDEEGEY